MPLNDIAQKDNVDVSPQKIHAIPRWDSLGFRESTPHKIDVQISLKRRACGLRETFHGPLWLLSVMPQGLPKTERVDKNLHGSPAHTCRHFTRKKSR
jgi:hypothetical protein